MARVINLRHEPALKLALARYPRHAGNVLIDRRTEWGNPFRIDEDGTRDQVIELYRQHLWRRIRTGQLAIPDLADLSTMRLCCWCHPRPCHGHILARAAEWAAREVSAFGPNHDF